MRLGLTPWVIADTNDAKTLSDQAVFAERLGFEYFFLPEHHFTRGSAIPDPLMLLAGVAAATTKIRLATTSYLLPLRHPIQAAEQVAVLDQMSNGRLTLGIGRGYMPALYETFGVDLKKKRTIFRDCLDQMMRAWSGEPVAFDAQDRPVTISPRPKQEPHPPIWVAAFGPLALRQAGSLGFPYLASPMETKSRLAQNYAIHRQANVDAGTELTTEIPVMRSVFVSNDEHTLRRLRDRLDRETAQSVRTTEASAPISHEDWAIIGTPSEVQEEIEYYREEIGVTHLIVTRLRIGGVSTSDIKNSLEQVVELEKL